MQDKTYTPKEALLKAQNYCARQERYHQQVRDKLYQWGMHQNEVENIIAELISGNFLNEERFAKMFASGKFKIKKWGKIKIKSELKKKNISNYCIDKGLQEIPDDVYYETLNTLIEKKRDTITEKNKYIKNRKLANYVMNKGYEPNLVWEVIKDA